MPIVSPVELAGVPEVAVFGVAVFGAAVLDVAVPPLDVALVALPDAPVVDVVPPVAPGDELVPVGPVATGPVVPFPPPVVVGVTELDPLGPPPEALSPPHALSTNAMPKAKTPG